MAWCWYGIGWFKVRELGWVTMVTDYQKGVVAWDTLRVLQSTTQAAREKGIHCISHLFTNKICFPSPT